MLQHIYFLLYYESSMPPEASTGPHYYLRTIMQFTKYLAHYYSRIIVLRHALQPSCYLVIKLLIICNFIIIKLSCLLASEFLINSLLLLMIHNFIMAKLPCLLISKSLNNSFLLLIICNFIIIKLLYLLMSKFLINSFRIIALLSAVHLLI